MEIEEESISETHGSKEDENHTSEDSSSEVMIRITFKNEMYILRNY